MCWDDGQWVPELRLHPSSGCANAAREPYLSVLATSSVKPRATTWLTGQWAEVKHSWLLLQNLAQGVDTECGADCPLPANVN